jgi:hypothetical protein
MTARRDPRANRKPLLRYPIVTISIRHCDTVQTFCLAIRESGWCGDYVASEATLKPRIAAESERERSPLISVVRPRDDRYSCFCTCPGVDHDDDRHEPDRYGCCTVARVGYVSVPKRAAAGAYANSVSIMRLLLLSSLSMFWVRGNWIMALLTGGSPSISLGIFRRSLTRFQRDRFVLALAGTVAAATLFPCQGSSARAFHALGSLAISAMFFLQGARLSRAAIAAGATHWRLHVIIAFTTFGLFPLLGSSLLALAPHALPRSLMLGVLFVCVLPSTCSPR